MRDVEDAVPYEWVTAKADTAAGENSNRFAKGKTPQFCILHLFQSAKAD